MSPIGASDAMGEQRQEIGAQVDYQWSINLEMALLAAILLLAGLLRFYRLDGSSLWSDEGNSWALTQRNFHDIALAAAADIHPPGYYWLLKVWTSFAGASAAGMRSFSALCGVLLVFVIERTARLSAPDSTFRWLPLVAAFIAALNPFQVYYSQEARMYMPLALVSAGLFWALFVMVGQWASGVHRKPLSGPEIGYFLCGVVGLWFHYTFPVILAAAAGSFFLMRWRWRKRRFSAAHPAGRSEMRFLVLNGLIVLAFLPWAPTAVERVLTWPKGGEHVTLLEGMMLVAHTLLFGPLRSFPEPVWPWLLMAVAAPLMGIVALRRTLAALALLVWLTAPVLLMAGAGLFSDAFLKFVLVASPAWCILAAAAAFIVQGRWRWMTIFATLALALILALATLPGYYGSTTARDNYKGVAAYLAAVGDRATDIVLLNAPGQSEVWRYYDPGLSIAALPRQRPPDPHQTVIDLAAAVAGRRNIYALFWAADESDPQRIVETWLDQNAFKGLESWQGNLRFVHYVQATDLLCQESDRVALANGIELVRQCQPARLQRVAGGDVALVQLGWQADAPISQRYKVGVQLLDDRNQVIAQHDSEPAGGSRPTTSWGLGETVTDNHGVAVPIGAPPGLYKLIAVVYNEETGERLAHPGGDLIDLGAVEVTRPSRPFPLDLLPIQQRLNVSLGSVVLMGADAYKKGFAHAPETPLRPGDTAHVTLYWQSPTPLPSDWPADESFTLTLGAQSLTAPLAGGAFPTGHWLAGDLIRGEFDIPFDGSAQQPVISVDAHSVELAPLPTASR